MKQSFLFKGIAIFSLLFVIASCNKYEEGSNFSLLPAKARMVNDWNSTSYDVTTAAGTNSSSSWALSIKSDGTYTSNGSWLGFSFDENGTWTFNSDKTALLLVDSDGDSETWDIIKLKNKELKLQKVETVIGVETTSTVEFGE